MNELPFTYHLTIVQNGELLMQYLSQNPETLPDVIFLDLNMPRKTGFECLTEIKENELLSAISVVIFSTSYPKNVHFEENMIHILNKIGAQDFIRKPHDFQQLKLFIHHALNIVTKKAELNKAA